MLSRVYLNLYRGAAMKNVLLSAVIFASLVPVAGCIIVSDNEDVCGDGVATGAESCDDGNLNSGDGCSSVCTVESSVCGDNIKATTEACDDGNTVSNDGCSATCAIEQGANVGAKWNIKTNNVAGACPAGFNTARVISHPHALPLTNNSQDKIDLFGCAAGQGITTFLAPGAYDVWTEIVDQAGANVYAQSVPAYVDLTNTDKDVTFDIHTDKGYYFLAWSLQGGAGALTCAQAPEVASISLDTTPATPPTLFDCNQGAGYSLATAVGSYQVAVAALNAQQASLGPAATFANRAIQAPNKYTNLGTAMLMITGR